MLTKLGHTALEAVDGIAALERFDEAVANQQPFHAIFMDFVMPNMDGE